MNGPRRQIMKSFKNLSHGAPEDTCNRANEPDPIDESLERAALEQLFENLPQALIATIVNSSLLVFVLSPLVTPPSLIIWLSLMYAVTASRFALVMGYRFETSKKIDRKRWHRYFFTGAALTAALWGVAGTVLFPTQSLEHQVFVGFVLAGMTAGASISMAADEKVRRCCLLVALVPYTLSLAAEAAATHLAMVTICVTFIITTELASRKNSKTIRDALRLRFVNATLATDLERTLSPLQSANAGRQDIISEPQKTLQSFEYAAREAKASTNAMSQCLTNLSHEIRMPGDNQSCDPASRVEAEPGSGAISAEAPSSAIDVEALAPMRSARPDIFARLVKTYLAHAPSIVREINSAHGGGDLESLGRLAHSLKSSSANLGANGLAALCQDLEHAVRDQNRNCIRELVFALSSAFDTVSTTLRKLADTAPVLQSPLSEAAS